MSLLPDNTAGLITLNNHPRSEFIYLHHFLQPARILEDKRVSVFNDNVLPGFSDLRQIQSSSAFSLRNCTSFRTSSKLE